MGFNNKVAVIGHGYWGRNIARVFSQGVDFDLHTVCDREEKSLASVAKLYPQAQRVNRFEDISNEVGVVAVITPADTHFEIAKYFLERGKHILLTKPYTRTLAQAEELAALARKKNLCIFVDHTFAFNPAVRKLKEMMPKIGQPYFVLSQRLNLGLYQPDVNVIYDLMPHDLTILSYLFDQPVVKAQTSAFRAADLPQEDLAHASFELSGGLKGLITVSWLSPYKIRQFVIVGSEGMLSYDDTEVTEKIKYFDRGIALQALTAPGSEAAYTSRISYRSGDLYSPAISGAEALAFEMVEFKKAILDPQIRAPYDRLNLNVMKGLDAVLSSLGTQNG